MKQLPIWRSKLFMMTLIALVVVVCGIGYQQYQSYYGITMTSQRGVYTNIDPTGLKEMLGSNIKIIDLRRPEEWATTGVVEGSLQITAFDKQGHLVDDFNEKFTSQVNPEDQVVLICHSGNRSSVIAGAITDHMGYKNVYNVVGGIAKWSREGYPVSKAQ